MVSVDVGSRGGESSEARNTGRSSITFVKYKIVCLTRDTSRDPGTSSWSIH